MVPLFRENELLFCFVVVFMNFCRDKFRLIDNMFKGLMQKVASKNHPKMNSQAKK